MPSLVSSQPKPLPRSKAWVAVLINLLAFPGLGTITAKRPIGYAQAALMLLGFGIFVGFIFWFMAGLVRVSSDGSADLGAFRDYVWSRTWIAGLGLGVCAIAWIWSLFSSISILRESRTVSPPLS